jgi:hypothetical protein
MGQIKGTILSKVVRSLRKRRNEATPLVPPHLRHYLDERILSTTWHEEEDYFALMQVLAKLLVPPPGLDVWEYMGRDSAERDLGDVYKLMVRPGDPLATVSNLNTYWRMRHDTGRVNVTSQGPREAVVDISGYVLAGNDICRSLQGTIWQLLHTAGAKEIRIHKEQCRASGAEVCRWRARWAESSPASREFRKIEL